MYDASVKKIGCITKDGEWSDVSVEAVCAIETGEYLSLFENVTEATDDSAVTCFCRMVFPYSGSYVLRNDFVKDGLVPEGMRLQSCEVECEYMCARLWVRASCGEDENYCIDQELESWFYDDGELDSYLVALFSKPETPCTIGISKLMVSTGDSFQLYAEQYTEHALVVQYNDEKCYLKLEEGQGGLNVMANGIIYHVIE